MNECLQERNTLTPLPLPENNFFVENSTNSWFTRKSMGNPLVPIMPYLTNKTTMRTRLIAFRANKELRVHIRRAMRITREIYNKCVELCCRGDDALKPNKKKLRMYLITDSQQNIIPDDKWPEHKLVPYAVRDHVVDEFITAYKTQFAKFDRGQIKHFKMQFRSCRANQEAITIPHKDFKIDKKRKTLCLY